MLRLLVVGVGLLVLVALVVVAVGYLLPVAHVASRETTLERDPGDVFAAIADVTHYPEWRADVRSVEVLSSLPLRWREHGRNGDITLVVSESTPPSRLVSRIDDSSLAFGGTWTYELTPVGRATLLRITERGEVYNPVFRVMSRFVFGHTATIDAYLAALGARVARR